MPYNTQFPATYQPMYYAPQYQPQMPMQQPMQQQATQQQAMPQAPSGSMIWIQGEAGAKSYMVAPNTTVPLWDSESQRIYLKSVDAAGMPTMKILTYTIEETPSLGAPAQRAVSAPVRVTEPNDGMLAKAKEVLEGEIQAVRSDLEAIRSEMETFRGDLYGIAGKKTTATAANRKKEVSGDD